ncbi:efflux RND transporter periplasmic adaptor subunit [Brasilonema bromeliae]|nr:efflux RND transporter periplasmic adaptor subunit [Brasilonema bromeliae]
MNTHQSPNPNSFDELTSRDKRRKRGYLGSMTLIAGIGALVTGLLAIGILPRLQQRAELKALAKSAQTDVPTVNFVKPKRAANFTVLSLPASIQANQETSVYARTNGYLRRRTVDIGDKVQAGQILAEIDTPETDQEVAQSRAELARAQANLAQARANLAQKQSNFSEAKSNLAARQAELMQARTNLELARQTWQRWQELQQQGAVTQQAADERKTSFSANLANVDAVKARVNSDQNSVNAALASINSDQANVNAYLASVAASRASVEKSVVLQSFKRVTAPYNGVITGRNVETGGLISAGSNSNSSNAWLFKIAQTNSLRIRVNVPQTLIQSIRQGQTAQIHVRELPSKPFTGKVVRTSDSLDPKTNTLLTEIQVPNPNDTVRPGMYAQVTFTTTRMNPPMLIPANTLVVNSEGTQVASVTRDQTVHYHKVELGRDYGTEVEVISGLNPNESLITNPSDDLGEGARVQAVAVKPKGKS